MMVESINTRQRIKDIESFFQELKYRDIQKNSKLNKPAIKRKQNIKKSARESSETRVEYRDRVIIRVHNQNDMSKETAYRSYAAKKLMK